MHIFIDESGTFTFPQEGTFSPCIVGALIIPDHKLDLLFRRYARTRTNLPKERGEVKGRLLSEKQVDDVVEWLLKNDCVFEAVVVEMALETAAGVQAHREEGAHRLTENLTEEHHPNLVRQVHGLRRRAEEMAVPLYVQSIVTMHLLGNILTEVPVYWAQRQMKEILNFHWVIDGKGAIETTNAEDWWSTTMLGFLQSRLAREPMIALEGVDYSKFEEKFRMEVPDYLRQTLLPDAEEGFDLKLLMQESFRFSANPEPGLELVDIMTNATRRALKGNLGREGWQRIPCLMISRRGGSLRMRSLTADVESAKVPYGQLVTGPFSKGGRHMLPQRN